MGKRDSIRDFLQAYALNWRWAAIVILLTSALLTSAEPFSMLLMAFPVALVYGLTLALLLWIFREEEGKEI